MCTQIVSPRCLAFAVLDCMYASNPGIEGKGVQTRRGIESAARCSLAWQHFSRAKNVAEKRQTASCFNSEFGEEAPIIWQLWSIRGIVSHHCFPPSCSGPGANVLPRRRGI